MCGVLENRKFKSENSANICRITNTKKATLT